MSQSAIPARPSSGVPLRCAEPRSLLMLHIVSDAVRAAALAPSEHVALDIAGEALTRLAGVLPDLVNAAQLAEAVLSRGRWVAGSTDPEAVALFTLRAALAKVTEVAHG